MAIRTTAKYLCMINGKGIPAVCIVARFTHIGAINMAAGFAMTGSARTNHLAVINRRHRIPT